MNEPAREDLRSALASFVDDPASSVIVSDVDGTLAPIVQDPKAAHVPDDTVALLQSLSRDYMAVGVLTGRGIDDLFRMMYLPELFYVGNHGIEFRHGETHTFDPEILEALPLLSKLKKKIHDSEMARIPGVIIEDKEFAVGIHYRQVHDEGKVSEVERYAESLAIGFGFELLRGKKVRELRPAAAGGKDHGLELLLEHASQIKGNSPARVVFFGDDITDIAAFKYLDKMSAENGLEVVTVAVAGGSDQAAEVRDSAQYLVQGTEGVVEALRFLQPKQ